VTYSYHKGVGKLRKCGMRKCGSLQRVKCRNRRAEIPCGTVGKMRECGSPIFVSFS
jgi:hypothetical protein